MAAIYPIATTTVGSGGSAEIDFQNIPDVYTDLLVKLSGQANNSASSSYSIRLKFNNNAANYSFRYIRGSGSAVISANTISTTYIYLGEIPSTFISNTFGNLEIYIPNYTTSNAKSVSGDGVTEQNATNAWATITAGLWDNSSVINRVTLFSSENLAQYSTATLYGIR